MAVAIFCFEQAQQAIALVRKVPGEVQTWHGLNEFDRTEFYVLKLDHVYEACCQLNRGWPSVFTKPARSAANSFMQLWNGTATEQLCEACASDELHDGPKRQLQAQCEACQDGKERCLSCLEPVCDDHARYRFGTDLRDAYAHYEAALANPSHPLRADPRRCFTVRGIRVPSYGQSHSGGGSLSDGLKVPNRVDLLDKDYRLDGVFEALVELEREFSAVLIDPETGLLREDA